MVQFDCGADRTLTLSVSVASRPITITQSDIDMFDTLIEIVHNSKVHGGVCHMLIYTFYYVLCRKSFLLFLRGMLRQTLGSFWGEPCPTHGGELIEESEETQQ